MMKKIFLLILLICFNTASLAGEPKTKAVTPAEALKAIKVFKRNPIGDKASSALQTVLIFSSKSDTVKVIIATQYVPWLMQEKYKEALRSYLLSAYLVGNTEPQIVKKVKKDHPYEGMLMVIKTYKTLRAKRNVQKVAEVEKWIVLMQKGKLKMHARALTKEVMKKKLK